MSARSRWKTFETVTCMIYMKKKDAITNLIGCAPGLTLQPRQTASGIWVKFLRSILSKPMLHCVAPCPTS